MSSSPGAGQIGEGGSPLPKTVVLRVPARIRPCDVPALAHRMRALLREATVDEPGCEVCCDVSALVDADAGTLDALARLTLIARRRGAQLRLSGAQPDLHALLAFTGLSAVVPCADDAGATDGSGLDPRRQPEQRKEALGVEEERDPADPVP
jgi:ABC-type transporter Mla MlaB component